MRLLLSLLVLVFLSACAPSVVRDSPTESVVDIAVAADNNVPLKEFKVIASNFDFTPDTIRVQQGDRVRLVVTSEAGDHGLAIREFDVNLKVNEGQSAMVEFVADQKGSFTMYCSVYCGAGHGSMKGLFFGGIRIQ